MVHLVNEDRVYDNSVVTLIKIRTEVLLPPTGLSPKPKSDLSDVLPLSDVSDVFRNP